MVHPGWMLGDRNVISLTLDIELPTDQNQIVTTLFEVESKATLVPLTLKISHWNRSSIQLVLQPFHVKRSASKPKGDAANTKTQQQNRTCLWVYMGQYRRPDKQAQHTAIQVLYLQ